MSGATVFLYVQLDFTISEQEEHLNMRKSETYRNEIKSYIVRTGMTMTEVVDYLSTTSPMNTAGHPIHGKYGEASICNSDVFLQENALSWFSCFPSS